MLAPTPTNNCNNCCKKNIASDTGNAVLLATHIHNRHAKYTYTYTLVAHPWSQL